MNIYTNRPYQEGDLNAILRLVKARPADRIDHFPDIVSLQELLALTQIQPNTRLWLNEAGQAVGFAIRDCDSLFFDVASDALPTVGPLMIAWGIEHARTDPDAPAALYVGCRDTYPEQLALLLDCGFVLEPEDRTVHMVRPLDQPIPAPSLPPGFTIRPVAGEHEAEKHVALHRAAWGTEVMTIEYHLAMVSVPTYERELDLVAVTPDGRFAAYCMCHFSAEENAMSGCKAGYTDPVATHPDFQRRGLARALLLEGLRRLKNCGMTEGRLGTSESNIAMIRAAEAAGFAITSRTLFLSRALAGAGH